MRKVGGIEERLVAHYFDRERHGQLFRLDTDEATAIFDLFLDVSARVLAFAYSELVRRNVSEVSLVGRVQTFKQQQQPGHPALQESDADPRETFEDAVVNNVRAVDCQAPGMAQGVYGYVHIHMIHAEAVVRPAMDGQAAAESIRLGINRPVHLRT